MCEILQFLLLERKYLGGCGLLISRYIYNGNCFMPVLQLINQDFPMITGNCKKTKCKWLENAGAWITLDEKDKKIC